MRHINIVYTFNKYKIHSIGNYILLYYIYTLHAWQIGNQFLCARPTAVSMVLHRWVAFDGHEVVWAAMQQKVYIEIGMDARMSVFAWEGRSQ